MSDDAFYAEFRDLVLALAASIARGQLRFLDEEG
jgi:hypothetical protein